MRMRRTPTNTTDVARYEALVRTTATMVMGKVEMDYDDICQRLRIKAWKAMQAYNGKRDRNDIGVDRFVYACLQGEKKDLLKRVKRNDAYIEDIAPEGEEGYENGHVTRYNFEARYLMEGRDQAFRAVEEELPLIPSTLSRLERQIIHFLYLDYDYGEISSLLGIPRKEVAPLVRRIREKMADWMPDVQRPESNDGTSRDLSQSAPQSPELVFHDSQVA